MSTNATSKIDVRGYEERAIKALKEFGFRITMPTVQVVRVFASCSKALSAYKIHEMILEGNGRIDIVSVYRILDRLETCGLVVKVGTRGEYIRAEAGEGYVLVDAENNARDVSKEDWESVYRSGAWTSVRMELKVKSLAAPTLKAS